MLPRSEGPSLQTHHMSVKQTLLHSNIDQPAHTDSNVVRTVGFASDVGIHHEDGLVLGLVPDTSDAVADGHGLQFLFDVGCSL